MSAIEGIVQQIFKQCKHELTDTEYERLFLIANSSEDDSTTLFYVILTYLWGENSSSRLFAVRALNYLMKINSTILYLSSSNLPSIIDLSSGKNPFFPLPQPIELAEQLQKEFSQYLGSWSELYGASYPLFSHSLRFMALQGVQIIPPKKQAALRKRKDLIENSQKVLELYNLFELLENIVPQMNLHLQNARSILEQLAPSSVDQWIGNLEEKLGGINSESSTTLDSGTIRPFGFDIVFQESDFEDHRNPKENKKILGNLQVNDQTQEQFKELLVHLSRLQSVCRTNADLHQETQRRHLPRRPGTSPAKSTGQAARMPYPPRRPSSSSSSSSASASSSPISASASFHYSPSPSPSRSPSSSTPEKTPSQLLSSLFSFGASLLPSDLIEKSFSRVEICMFSHIYERTNIKRGIKGCRRWKALNLDSFLFEKLFERISKKLKEKYKDELSQSTDKENQPFFEEKKDNFPSPDGKAADGAQESSVSSSDTKNELSLKTITRLFEKMALEMYEECLGITNGARIVANQVKILHLEEELMKMNENEKKDVKNEKQKKNEAKNEVKDILNAESEPKMADVKIKDEIEDISAFSFSTPKQLSSSSSSSLSPTTNNQLSTSPSSSSSSPSFSSSPSPSSSFPPKHSPNPPQSVFGSLLSAQRASGTSTEARAEQLRKKDPTKNAEYSVFDIAKGNAPLDVMNATVYSATAATSSGLSASELNLGEILGGGRGRGRGRGRGTEIGTDKDRGRGSGSGREMRNGQTPLSTPVRPGSKNSSSLSPSSSKPSIQAKPPVPQELVELHRKIAPVLSFFESDFDPIVAKEDPKKVKAMSNMGIQRLHRFYGSLAEVDYEEEREGEGEGGEGGGKKKKKWKGAIDDDDDDDDEEEEEEEEENAEGDDEGERWRETERKKERENKKREGIGRERNLELMNERIKEGEGREEGEGEEERKSYKSGEKRMKLSNGKVVDPMHVRYVVLKEGEKEAQKIVEAKEKEIKEKMERERKQKEEEEEKERAKMKEATNVVVIKEEGDKVIQPKMEDSSLLLPTATFQSSDHLPQPPSVMPQSSLPQRRIQQIELKPEPEPESSNSSASSSSALSSILHSTEANMANSSYLHLSPSNSSSSASLFDSDVPDAVLPLNQLPFLTHSTTTSSSTTSSSLLSSSSSFSSSFSLPLAQPQTQLQSSLAPLPLLGSYPPASSLTSSSASSSVFPSSFPSISSSSSSSSSSSPFSSSPFSSSSSSSSSFSLIPDQISDNSISSSFVPVVHRVVDNTPKKEPDDALLTENTATQQPLGIADSQITQPEMQFMAKFMQNVKVNTKTKAKAKAKSKAKSTVYGRISLAIRKQEIAAQKREKINWKLLDPVDISGQVIPTDHRGMM
ncbi:uncharacterized protein MONOS_4052 [Monocercomonoides exilis]|uniref:uncharacterized protein n=1 Tax=Monocercomonoides exilis TaxID=2049356 RepID=UPI00355A63C1|nr:hypothetical protein MONOS_4052 [Monocercomonoides exilis]|eukprot:MONOS_4052.1-p1 / transcript=MONOS_4052.1 / gene=MONOS_4052 / organism=Monocercomonoides_exilis_PA203 / gene_product=unspecified product / transcript_product=unspecified product / location=Mono_scaffold00103:12261-16376(-) / protein_length=1372 / sequence_SO=supercontig / SO=protein_coding / is_pseudo=false